MNRKKKNQICPYQISFENTAKRKSKMPRIRRANAMMYPALYSKAAAIRMRPDQYRRDSKNKNDFRFFMRSQITAIALGTANKAAQTKPIPFTVSLLTIKDDNKMQAAR